MVLSKIMRHLLLVMIWVALLASVTNAATLTHGPMVGATSETAVNIWIRSDSAASAVVQYQPAGGNWSQPLQSTGVSLVAGNDFTGTVSLTGLSAASSYDYRVVLDGVVQASSASIFKTLPTTGAGSQFTFAFGANLQQDQRPHTIFNKIAAQQPNFALILGNTIYSDLSSPAATEADFWTAYKSNRADTPFQSFANHTPVFAIWNDHDYGTGGSDASYPLKNQSRAAFAKYWANPAYVEQNASTYYKFSVADTDFFMLDVRWNRVPGTTVLGAAQLQWLKDQLLASTASFKFIVSPVMVSDFGSTGADFWAGFATERSNIFQYIAQNNIKNVIFISGDQQWTGTFLINYPTFEVAYGVQGFYEISPSPLAAAKRSAPHQNDSQVLFETDQDNYYGLARVDTTVLPRQIHLEIHRGSDDAIVYAETVEEFTPTQSPDIVTSSLPQGTLNSAYSQTLTAVGGVAPYQWSLTNGSLPFGVTLNQNGTISGTPAQTGTFFFTAAVKDTALATSSRTLSLVINVNPPAAAIPTSGLIGYWNFDDGTATDNSGNGNNGTLVNGPSAIAGKSGQALNYNGLNQYVNIGTVLNPGTGDLSVFAWVKTTQPGGYNMIVSKRDSSLSNNSGYQLFQNGNGAPSFTFSDGNSNRTRVDSTGPRINDGNWHLVGVVFTRSGNGVLYVDGVAASNGSGSITSQSGNVTNSLPLRFGTENQNSNSTFAWAGTIDEVRIYNRALSAQEISNIYTATSPLTILTSALPAGTNNVSYNQNLAVSGGIAPYTWSITSDFLPQGLTLSVSGTISGTPTVAATSSFTVQVQDSASQTATQPLSITINPQSLAIVTNSLPSGTVNTAYSQTLTASGGTPSYTWTLAAGSASLPHGLTLSSTGIISGTPTTAGTANFTVQVQDSAVQTATQSLSIAINPVAPPLTAGLGGYWSFDDGSATDNSGNGNNGTFSANSPAVGVPGKSGLALSFNGFNQYVNVGNVLNPGTSDLSVFAWVKTTQVGGFNMIVSKRDSSLSNNSGYQLFQNGSGALSFTFSDGNSNRARVDSSGPRINDGNWHLAGVVFTRSGSGVLYVDGVAASNGSGSITGQSGSVTNSLPLRFATENQNNNSAFGWDGAIDEVRIYNRALSAQDVIDLYNAATTPPTVVTNSLASGTVNTAYNQTLTASGGTPSYSWTLAAGSSLPQGLTLSLSGTISGTPTTAGTTNFTVQVQDSASQTATQPLSITINPQSLTIATNSLPSGTVNTAYSQTLTASGGTPSYTWTLAAGSSLPPGLTLSSIGTISGTPTTAGTANFTVQVQDSAVQTATQSLSITINPAALPLTSGLSGYWSFDDGTATDNSGNGNNGTLVNGPTVIAGKSGQALNFNGLNQYVNIGTVLNPGTGDLSVFAWVKTTQPGGYNMIVSKRDSSLSNNSGYQLFQNGNGAPSFTFSDGNSNRTRVDSTGPRINDGNWHLVGVVFTRSGNGVLYVDGVAASNGSGSITSQSGNVTNSLPLRFGTENQNSNSTFAWAGTIDEVRIYNRALSAQDITDLYNAATTPLAIVTHSLPSGTVNAAYNQTLAASGGTPNYSWTLASGSSLPQGLTLSLSGTISGIPTTAGTTNFTVQVQDSASQTATQPLSITINPQALTIATNSLPSGTVNAAYNQTLTASGGTPSYSWTLAAGSASLPQGLTLSSIGTISGTPTTAGTTNFTVQVQDSGSQTAMQSLTIAINATSSLVGFWSFDDGTASDNSGNGNNGTLVNGPTAVAGKVGQGLSLNGTNQYVNVGTMLNPGTGDLSVFAWVRTTQPGGFNMIVSKRDSSLGNNSGYQLFQNGNGALSFTFANGQSSRARVDSSGPRINDGNWHLIGVVFIRSANGVLYVDGAAATGGSGSITGQSGNVTNSLPLRFGTEDQTNNQSFFWNGALDEVRIYNRALSTQEVSDLYNAAASPLLVVSNTLPAGTTGAAYNQTLTASGGTLPYTWSLLSGSLPQGLSLSQNGTISGAPTGSGTSNFTVQVQDSGSRTATQSFTLMINSGSLNIVSSSLPNSPINVPYNQTLTASGGTPPYSWSVISGSLPQGISLSQNGTISGVPIALGTSTFLVQVQDSALQKAIQLFRVTILITTGLRTNVGYWSFDDGTAFDNSGMRNDGTLVNSPTVVPGKKGQALNFDGVSQYVNIGPVLDTGSGDLSIFAWVKTTQPGGFNMIVSKRDSSVTTNPGYQLFQNSNGALSFTFANGQSSRVRVDSTGPRINDGNWHLVGVVFTRSANGVLYVDGAPAVGGSGDISTQSGNEANPLSLRIGAEEGGLYWKGAIDDVRMFTRRALSAQEISDMYNQPLTIVSNSLLAGANNVAYSQTLLATGGTSPYTWSIASGSLPQGLSLSPSGTISGTPTAVGTFSFTIRLDDTALGTTTQSFNLTINSLTPQTLLSDNFTGTFANWTVVDEGTSFAPSIWVISNGDLIQQSDIQGGTFLPSDPNKPGTYAYAGNTSWQDYSLSLRVMSEDDDELGVMFRFQDSKNYYRFSMDNERPGRRLIKVVNGVPSFVATDTVAYEIGQVYNLRVSVSGTRIQIFLDQKLVFDVVDTSFPTGKIALYTWGDQFAHFGDVLVTSP